MLAPLANRVYVSFEESRGHFKPEKVLATGNPVRRGLQRGLANAQGLQNGNLFTVLVLGGSQGAHGINMAMEDALEMLSHRKALAVVHQTGRQDETRLRQAYQHYGIAATVGVFFDDMPTLYRQASLVICRAGATTVAELVAMGKASILIPFPFAADDHQALNAQHLVRSGAAELIREKDLTGRLLAERIEHYRMHPEKLAAMAARASSLGKPEAARLIVDDCYALAANLIQ
jgi:UDP-N-acetylglucosamine--N-acetylmuramyl-(pentapeptide) pyrophosphoryl-undecaprenol N-acetylglucosamine transferase